MKYLFTSLLLGTVQSSQLSFIFFGDWGYNVPADQSESGIDYEGAKVAAQVAITAADVSAEFFVLLGDNFYNNGVSSDTDPAWYNYYQKLYTAPSTQVPWYPVLGNHDYYGTHTPYAEIQYYKNKRDHRWFMPDYNYTKTWVVDAQAGVTLQIIFVDTVTLAPHAASRTGVSGTNLPSDYKVLDAIRNPQLKWIEQTLEASTATYKLIAGHYHVYTVTDGDGPTIELVEYLVPLMRKYGVVAYLNGHEHNQEHTIWEGIHFITSGHGCDKDDPLNQAGFQGLYAADGLQFAQDVGGFGVMEATAKSLSFRFVAESGHTIYSANIVTNGAVELGMPFKYPTFAPTSAILPSVAPTKKPTRKPTRKPTYKPSTKSMHKKKH